MVLKRVAAAPAVSVLMPVYNRERWLSQAIDSVLAQTFPDFELILVDDGSTDASVSIAEAFADRDPRVRLVRTAHAGVRSARSVTLAKARARFVAFLDADDEWVPHRLEREFPHAGEQTVVFSDFWHLGDGDAEVGWRHSDLGQIPNLHYPATGLFPHLLDRGCFVNIDTVLAPRELLLDAGAFRHAERHGRHVPDRSEDFEMWLLLALRGARFHYLDEPLAVYRRHAESLSADVVRGFENQVLIADALMSEAEGRDRRLLRQARRRWLKSVVRGYRKRGWERVAAGEAAAARRAFVRSLRARPHSPRSWLVLLLTLRSPLARRLVRGRV